MGLTTQSGDKLRQRPIPVALCLMALAPMLILLVQSAVQSASLEYGSRGISEYMHGHYAAAVPRLQTWLRVSDLHDEADTHRMLAVCYLHQRQPALALQEYRRVAQSPRAEASDLSACADLLSQSGNVAAARRQWLQAIRAAYEEMPDRTSYQQQYERQTIAHCESQLRTHSAIPSAHSQKQ